MIKTLNIKALSVNEAWKGKRFKTKAYLSYQKAVLLMLPKIIIPEGNLRLELIFGFSSSGSDIDNGIKNFTDILSKKYGFNDNRIYELNIKKEIVKKGKEFIKFKIENYDNNK